MLFRSVEAIAQQPASIRAPSTDVAPARVLDSWLHHVAALDPALSRSRAGWSWAIPVHRTDLTVLAVAAGAPRDPLPTAAFLDALITTGLSRTAATQELLRTPLLRRTSRGRYVLR